MLRNPGHSSCESLAAKRRLAILEAGLEPLTVVPSIVHLVSEASLVLEPRLQGCLEGCVERALAVAQPDRGVLTEPVGERLRPVVDRVGLAYLVDEAELLRFLWIDPVAGEHDLLCLREADQSWEPLGAAAVWEGTKLDLKQTVPRVPADDPEVTG